MNIEPGGLTPELRRLESERVKDAILRLLRHCRTSGWMGYDPYDALNSRIVKALPFLKFRAARLALTQGIKRCPVNLRPFLLVPRSINPKGVALFLSSITKLDRIGAVHADGEIRSLTGQLLDLRSPEHQYSCWGYNFDWQTRHKLVPAGSPNIICSTFSGNALLDAEERISGSVCRAAALSAAEFITDVLAWRPGKSIACISYTPLWRSEIHNANLLGAAFLCRVGRITGQKRFTELGLDAARYSTEKQRADGSWPYGEALRQGWIDNFHTGFNLLALKSVKENARTDAFDPAIRSGLSFYKRHFFCDDGAPKYYHDAVYPIDIHSIAQSIITLIAFADDETNLALARKVLSWGLANMRSAGGFFYYQKHRLYTNRIPYMRWAQAWMMLALATYLEASQDTPAAGGPRIT
jgi:hypothetical protein